MEFHPLNLAHQQHRRADAHLKNHRYDDAIQCHHKAAELLLDVLKITTNSVVVESVTLQHSYHLKQKDFIKNKKEQHERAKKALENIKCLSKDSQCNLNCNDISKLQVAICRSVNESDSLLNRLSHKYGSNDKDLERNTVDVEDGNVTELPPQKIVEELQNHNQNLVTIIDQLLLQVEIIKDNNITLHERINYLEKERIKYLNIKPQDESLERNDFSALSLGSDSSRKNSLKDQIPSHTK
ncbi:unnamed protein product [Euphydryas editha]|uniref:Nuclear receptor-binding factor 2 MIT domain-containing protein n=1 Tax=Euphydryas editha TaxID=104508 RepID=A0AAU9TCH8_EUPED|nr:unnamed protein product [Euphydryas editha]